MVDVDYSRKFMKDVSKLDKQYKQKVRKQTEKIIYNPLVGKPLRYTRKNTREVYIKPFRLVYIYSIKDDKITFLSVYHKDKQ